MGGLDLIRLFWDVSRVLQEKNKESARSTEHCLGYLIVPCGGISVKLARREDKQGWIEMVFFITRERECYLQRRGASAQKQRDATVRVLRSLFFVERCLLFMQKTKRPPFPFGRIDRN